MTAPPAPRTEAEQLREIIEWLLGERGEFPEQPEGQRHALYWWQRHALYWWRKELRRRVETVRVVPPVAPRRVPPSVTLSDGGSMQYRHGDAKPWARVWPEGNVYALATLSDHVDLTDDDLAACLALRDAPPSDPVREAVKGLFTEAYRGALELDDNWRDIEQLTDAALALIDQHAAPELTAEQCVARLVELGWTDRPGIQVGAVMRRALIAPAPERAP